MEYILLWVSCITFSVMFTYYTSNKTYHHHIVWWHRKVEGNSDEQIEKRVKEFLEWQEKEDMTRKQRVRGTLEFLALGFGSGIFVTLISVFETNIKTGITMGVYASLMLTLYLATLDIISGPLRKLAW